MPVILYGRLVYSYAVSGAFAKIGDQAFSYRGPVHPSEKPGAVAFTLQRVEGHLSITQQTEPPDRWLMIRVHGCSA
ncbi:hypothetical protein SAMN05443245_2187 [Paraburkholderia fungorum]|uniref:Uncharacterized protein n=1 Tax=Paraburkholderia fungorum TaxID=134537 RepID=A0A1H1CLA6_9BURK|nr:hypothetical protein SAMN05443245_2187 [Paraburkholderia fungorum]